MTERLFVMLEILINHLFVMVNKMNHHLSVNLAMVKNHLSENLMMKMPLFDVRIIRNLKKHSFGEPMVTNLSFDAQMVRITMSFNSIYSCRFSYIPCTDRSEILLFLLIIIPFFVLLFFIVRLILRSNERYLVFFLFCFLLLHLFTINFNIKILAHYKQLLMVVDYLIANLLRYQYLVVSRNY